MKRQHKLILSAAILVALLAAAVLSFLSGGAASLIPWLTLAGAGGVPLLLRRDTCADFVAWRDDLSVGLDIIDSEHKKLLGLINNVLAANQCRTGPEFEREALAELLDYTEYHFKREEELMVQSGYRDYEGHKAQHDQMRGQVKLYLKRYEEQGRAVLPEVASHLKLWLLQHIAVTDRKLAPYLERHAQGSVSASEA
jgi:hemerythrin-like metal-binding protein